MRITRRALVQHKPEGNLYIIEYSDLPDGPMGDYEGTIILAAAGPINHTDLNLNGRALEPSQAMFDLINSWDLESNEDIDWLQDEDAFGKLTYPIITRPVITGI